MGYFLEKFGLSLHPLAEAEVDGKDMNEDNDQTNDYSADEDDNAEANQTTDGENNDENENTEQSDQDNAQQEDGQSEDETTDYTDEGEADPDQDNPDADSDSGDSGDSSGGDQSDADENPVDDIKKQEEELYANLTPDQLDIKHKELKNQFMNIYDVIESAIDRINDANIDESNMQVIKFISSKLFELKSMITDYMTNVYSTKSYIENSINYNRFLAVLSGINKMLEQLSKNEDK